MHRPGARRHPPLVHDRGSRRGWWPATRRRPRRCAETIAVLFIIATTLQVALWARELILGVIEHRAGGGRGESAASAARSASSALLVTIAIFVDRDRRRARQSRGQRHRPGRRSRHRRHRHRPRRQGIFDDLFSALAIIFDKPFRRGDSIRWDTTTGTVEKIGLKSTRVRAMTGEEVVISNTNLLSKELHNMARLNRRRIHAALRHRLPDARRDVCARIPEIVKEVVDVVREMHASCAAA